MKNYLLAIFACFVCVAVAVFFAVVFVLGTDSRGTTLPPSSATHKFGAVSPANGSPNFNDPVVTGGYCLDMEPQPLAYIDATLADGAVIDGGWYADAAAGRIPKGVLLKCSSTTADVTVDMLGFGGKAGQTNVTLTLACGVIQPLLVTKVYQAGTTATSVSLCY